MKEQRLKTVLVPTKITLGPRQNKADTWNWREFLLYVLFLKALCHFGSEPFVPCNDLRAQTYFCISVKSIRLTLPPQEI